LKRKTWLRELRGNRTQREMADELEINRAYYSQLECGKRGVSVETARRLAPKLGVDWTRFFEDEEDNPAAGRVVEQ